MTSPRRFGWDPAKSDRNRAARQLPFTEAERFEFGTAMVVVDNRVNYGEERLVATGLIGLQVHVLVYTMRSGTIWVISLRRANRREILRYERFLEEQG